MVKPPDLAHYQLFTSIEKRTQRWLERTGLQLPRLQSSRFGSLDNDMLSGAVSTVKNEPLIS